MPSFKKCFCLLTLVLSLCAFRVQIKGGKPVVELPRQPSAQPAPAPSPAPAATQPAATPDPEAKAGLCDASGTVGLCYVFSGEKNKEQRAEKGNQMACRIVRGKFTPGGACPTAGRLGKCTIKAGTPEEYVLVYYSGKFDTAKASADCGNPKSSIHIQGAGVWQGA